MLCHVVTNVSKALYFDLSVPALHTPSWEFSRSNLAIERVIGNGAFGVVSKAYALGLPDKPEWTIVAVKSLQGNTLGQAISFYH